MLALRLFLFCPLPQDNIFHFSILTFVHLSLSVPKQLRPTHRGSILGCVLWSLVAHRWGSCFQKILSNPKQTNFNKTHNCWWEWYFVNAFIVNRTSANAKVQLSRSPLAAVEERRERSLYFNKKGVIYKYPISLDGAQIIRYSSVKFTTNINKRDEKQFLEETKKQGSRI